MAVLIDVNVNVNTPETLVKYGTAILTFVDSRRPHRDMHVVSR